MFSYLNTEIYSVRLQFHDISLRHASNRCAPQMITLVGLVVATARLTILDRTSCFGEQCSPEIVSRAVATIRPTSVIICGAQIKLTARK